METILRIKVGQTNLGLFKYALNNLFFNSSRVARICLEIEGWQYTNIHKFKVYYRILDL